MAHHASAKKALRQNEKNRERNKSRSSDMKTQIKKLLAAVASNDLTLAQNLFKDTQSKIMRGAKNNILKKNTAARKVSRLALKVKALETKSA